MSFQKPEKDFGEGPVRHNHSQLHAWKLELTSMVENPQDPHHPHLAQGRLAREGLPGAD